MRRDQAIDWDMVRKRMRHPITGIDLSPPEVIAGPTHRSRLELGEGVDLRGEYLEFLAIKTLLIGRRGSEQVRVDPVVPGSLTPQRRELRRRAKHKAA